MEKLKLKDCLFVIAVFILFYVINILSATL